MKKIIPLSLIAALGAMLLIGCAGTPIGNSARSFENLPTNAPNVDLAQALVNTANKAQQTVPGPWTIPISAVLTLASAALGVWAHKSGVNSGVDASTTTSPTTAGPPKV
jgi:hypothetical protein